MSCNRTAARRLLLAGIAAIAMSPAAFAADQIAITTLSSRPDMVSGGNTLLRVDVPAGFSLGQIVVKLNGQDVTATFHADQTAHNLTGLVDGLKAGANDVEVFTNPNGNGQPAEHTTLVNHSINGPMFSGPRQEPFICQTQSFKLPNGTPLTPTQLTSDDCAAPTVVQYVYRSTAGGALKPMPSTSVLPSDVAMTTTDTGVTMPFVVRVETGTMDRGIYQNAILHDPTTEPAPTPFAPPKGWNKRLQGLHGVGCIGGWYIQGAGMGENPLAQTDLLARGFGIFINTLNHPTNSCNAFIAGEVTSMGKEHFIKTFGVPYYTVSRGCSGGSYTSEQVADAFPGLFDGILIDCTFPDPFAIALSGQDGHLLTHYFAVTDPTGFTAAQQAAVSGYANTTTLLAAANQSQRTDPVPGRVDVPNYTSAVWNSAVPVSLRYDPITNPRGARPTVYDENANVFGKDPATGFALRAFDNVGVQYGLAALNAGVITTTQFLNLNEKIGGYDQDENYVAQRTVGDAGAIKRAYEAGLTLNGGGGMSSIPVFDFTGIYSEDTTNYHLQWEHFATRERMREVNGDTANHVMWRANPSTIALDAPARLVFDQWMEAYKADTSNVPQRQKVISHKPAAAVDGCFTSATTFVAEPQTFSNQPNTTCNTLLPSFAFPRYVAGGPLDANKLKCQLKPINAADYRVTFTGAEMARLQAIFPTGVCDWSKPGINQVHVYQWPTSPATGVINLTQCVNPLDGGAGGLCTPPVQVSIGPQSINLRTGNGVVTAYITAAAGYVLSQWTVGNVTLNGIAATSGALSSDGGTFVATFDKGALSGLSPGDSVILTVAGTLAKNGNQGQFVATDSVKVMN